MADLPMAQIPNFQLGATPDPQAFSRSFQQVGSTMNQTAQNAMQNVQARQQMSLQQQQLDQQQQQQTISQVDTLLKSGMNYPGMLPTFWPAIASRMNSLSPDYKLDPNNPPENLPNFAKQLSSISDGLSDKVVSPPQAHAATMQLIQSSYPAPTPPDAGQGGASPAPQGTSTMQAPPQGQQPGMGQSPPPPQQQQGGQLQQPPSNPLTDFAQIQSSVRQSQSAYFSGSDGRASKSGQFTETA